MTAQAPKNALDFGPLPDPALGIFETMLVKDGELPMGDAHYLRLATSARELYSAEIPIPPAGPRPRPRRWWSGRTRLKFVPGEGLSAEVGPLGHVGPDPGYASIAAFLLPGGLGAHKWADRRLVDALTQEAGEGVLPLLIDSDGAVLEATWANVLIEERGRLISPPADGRSLPGIGRRQLRYDEEPVDLDRLLAADAVVLTSALRVVRLPGGLPLMPVS